MEDVAWSMIMAGCALFGMLGLWLIRGRLISTPDKRLHPKVPSSGSDPESR